MAVGASYIWRKYDRFLWNDRINFTSADYAPVNFQPTTCPAGARCEAITYFEPNFQIPSPNIYTNVPDRYARLQRLRADVTKRMSNNWSFNASYAYNDAVELGFARRLRGSVLPVELSARARPVCAGVAGSGIDNVFPNAKWLVKAGWALLDAVGFNLAGGYQGTPGYPFPQSVTTPFNRANGAGTVTILLDPMGEFGYETPPHAELPRRQELQLRSHPLVPVMEIFNLTNANTVLAQQRNQAGTTANRVSGIVAPA